MKFEHQTYDEERALYGICGGEVMDCKFDGPADGESALKETSDLTVEQCYFNLRYPFWHTKGAVIRDTTLTENCRAALWYDTDITLEHCRMNGIKALRECHCGGLCCLRRISGLVFGKSEVGTLPYHRHTAALLLQGLGLGGLHDGADGFVI